MEVTRRVKDRLFVYISSSRQNPSSPALPSNVGVAGLAVEAVAVAAEETSRQPNQNKSKLRAVGAWRKYPNQINTAVIRTDVSCILHTHRLVSSKRYFLQWAQIGSPNVCYASEQSTEDPGKRLKTINLTFGSFLSVYETLRYVPHPTDPCKTLLKHEATVQVEGVPLNLAKNISTNAGNDRQGYEWVIGKLNSEVKELATSIATSTTSLARPPRRFTKNVFYCLQLLELATSEIARYEMGRTLLTS
ncbi:slowmo [Culex quinquefasciatus]|uniref:Slowmo n=1 Tax=Culex quinquefasciatus TaxID=7176 RepID=B0XJT0_CULQU|nr:slowmo [Culex quinquefasciatus]|eukprot:XP_001869902.1 slowmo [Culex quinquefasciatus]